MVQEKPHPLTCVHFIQSVIEHDLAKQRVTQSNQRCDCHILFDLSKVKGTRSKWHIQYVDYAFDNTHLTHVFLLNLEVILFALDFIVGFEGVGLLKIVFTVFTVEVSLVVSDNPLYHLENDGLNLVLTFFRVAVIRVGNLGKEVIQTVD